MFIILSLYPFFLLSLYLYRSVGVGPVLMSSVWRRWELSSWLWKPVGILLLTCRPVQYMVGKLYRHSPLSVISVILNSFTHAALCSLNVQLEWGWLWFLYNNVNILCCLWFAVSAILISAVEINLLKMGHQNLLSLREKKHQLFSSINRILHCSWCTTVSYAWFSKFWMKALTPQHPDAQ